MKIGKQYERKQSNFKIVCCQKHFAAGEKQAIFQTLAYIVAT